MEVALLVVQIITLIALSVSVWKTATIARGTLDLVEETRQQRLSLFLPKVLMYIDPNEIHFAHIVVENVGPGTATNVTFSFEPPLQATQSRSALKFFEKPKLLGPGHRITQPFDAWPAYLNSELPKKYLVTIRYQTLEAGGDYETVQTLDLESLQHKVSFTRKGMHDLVEQIEKFRSETKRELEELRESIDRAVLRDGFLPGPVNSSAQAAKRLLELWRFWRAGSDDKKVFLRSLGFSDAIRSIALDGLSALIEEEATEQVREALIGVMLVASHHRFIGDEWSGELDQAMATLESSIDGDQLGR